MRIVQIPLLSDNYGYLIVCEATNEAAVVDPSEGSPVLERIKTERVNFTTVLNTHHHRDHTGGNPALLESYPHLRVFAHRHDQGRVPGLNHPVEDGDEVKIGTLRGRVLFIPGHTKAHVAYLFDDKLFCGDTLFVAGCGRLFEGTPEQMLASLSRLKDLPEATLVYCGHEYTEKNLQFAMTLEPGNPEVSSKLTRVRSLRARGVATVPSTIGEEKKTNPFFRWDSNEIQENLSRKAAVTDKDPLTVFTAARQLKDHY